MNNIKLSAFHFFTHFALKVQIELRCPVKRNSPLTQSQL
jgi:hypothetical protein